jgi:hypothetical protein
MGRVLRRRLKAFAAKPLPIAWSKRLAKTDGAAVGPTLAAVYKEDLSGNIITAKQKKDGLHHVLRVTPTSQQSALSDADFFFLRVIRRGKDGPGHHAVHPHMGRQFHRQIAGQGLSLIHI